MKRIAILGSTGSIGCSALAVVDANRDRLEVVGLAAGENIDRFVEQVERYRPRAIGLASHSALTQASDAIGARAAAALTHAAAGAEGLLAVATHPDVELVLCASSGTAALEAVLAAIEAGKHIALANKEVLVMAGALVTGAARSRGVPILPVDSEHNAIHQCLHGRAAAELKRVVLTASGGPFRNVAALDRVTPEDALQHPTWKMGPKITIDSATLMNKGLEVIEARWLFGVAASQIDVVIHPQSVVHSMIELTDGSMLAQLGVTDMRLPIQYAFSYPDRWDGGLPSLDLLRCGPLEFHAPDRDRFPCLELAYRALQAPGSMAVAMNAANEVAVAAFLERGLPFTGIPRLIERVMDEHEARAAEPVDVGEVRALDADMRRLARSLLSGLKSKV